MKGKGFKVLTILLIIVLIVGLGVAAFFIIQQNKEKEELQTKISSLEETIKKQENETEKLKNELNEKDEEQTKQVENVETKLTEREKEEIVKELYIKELKEISTDYEYDVEVTLTSLEELEDIYPGFSESYLDAENEIFASVEYTITAKGDATYDVWKVGNGEFDEDGNFVKTAVVEVAKENGEYVIVSSGTGW